MFLTHPSSPQCTILEGKLERESTAKRNGYVRSAVTGRAGASQGTWGGGGGGGSKGGHEVGGTCWTENGCVALPCSSGQSNFMGRSLCWSLPKQTDDSLTKSFLCKRNAIQRGKNTVSLFSFSLLFSLHLPSNEENPQFSWGERRKVRA